MADSKKSSLRIWDFLVILALVYLGSQVAFKYLFPQPAPVNQSPFELHMQDASLATGVSPVLLIKNNATSVTNGDFFTRSFHRLCTVFGGTCSSTATIATGETLTLPARCPQPPVDVYSIDDAGKATPVTSNDVVVPCDNVSPVLPNSTATISLTPWKESLFKNVGTYELRIPAESLKNASGSTLSGSGSTQAVTSVRFTISEPGVFVKLFRAFISKPLLNLLILVASVIPGHNLGWSIIALTLIVKLLLFIPTQHALEGQKKMQLLQPKIEAVKRQYGDNPQKMNEETMKLWKEHKVNPFQSCLPLLVQFPVLIGLFYVIREGSHLEVSKYLIYPFYQDLGWTFNTMFFGFDLSQINHWFFPPMLVLLQFIQMKLTFHISDKKKAKELKEKTTPEIDTAQELQQKLMIYLLPLMIGFFAFKTPSAVAIYWGVSTLFAIGQQVIVNREHIRP